MEFLKGVLTTSFVSAAPLQAHELLVGLQPPANLKGLCDFMLQVGFASDDVEVSPPWKMMMMSVCHGIFLNGSSFMKMIQFFSRCFVNLEDVLDSCPRNLVESSWKNRGIRAFFQASTSESSPGPLPLTFEVWYLHIGWGDFRSR